MTSRARYYHLRHTERLLLWQIARVQEQMSAERAKLRVIRHAHKWYKLGIPRVIADNVRVYNRAIAKGY